MSKILFSPQEDKIHILKPWCNFLFIIWEITDLKFNSRNDVIDIFTGEDFKNISLYIF